METEPTEATLDELAKKLEEEEELYAELLRKLDELAANPPPYERDRGLPELLLELNRSEALTLEEEEPPRGWKGFARSLLRRLLAPDLARLERALSRQRRFDSTLVQFLNRHSETGNAGAARAAEFASALVGFAQRIDRLADAKDRLYALLSNRRSDLLLEAMDKRLEAARLGIEKAQRGLEAMSSSLAIARAEMAARAAPAPEARASREHIREAHYVAFEDRFRGSPEEIRRKLAEYVRFFEGRAPVVDLGCGRGEFLELLGAANLDAFGVDGNSDMVRRCLERGLRAERGDVVDYVSRREAASLGGIFAAQLIEHLPPREIAPFLEACHRALRPGGALVVETVNPRSLLALVEAFFRDLTHEKPLHPETLDFALRAAGFGEVEILYSSPVSERARLLPVRDGGDDARTLNQNFEKLNAFLFGEQDYAAVAFKM